MINSPSHNELLEQRLQYFENVTLGFKKALEKVLFDGPVDSKGNLCLERTDYKALKEKFLKLYISMRENAGILYETSENAKHRQSLGVFTHKMGNLINPVFYLPSLLEQETPEEIELGKKEALGYIHQMHRSFLVEYTEILRRDIHSVGSVKEFVEAMSLRLAADGVEVQKSGNWEPHSANRIDMPFATLSEILQEFVQNARKSYKGLKRHHRISVSFQSLENHIVCTVEDRGIGMKSYDIKKILNPAEKHNVSTEGNNGFGLRFIISSLKLAGGELRCRSSWRHGTRFIMILPVVPSKSGQELTNT